MTKLDASGTADLIDLHPDSVVRPHGVVRATNTRDVYKPDAVTNWRFLKSGTTLEIPTDSALLVKRSNGFILAQFFEPGSITGPLVFSEVKAENPKEAYRRSSDFPHEFFGSAAGVLITAGTDALSTLVKNEDSLSNMDKGLSLIMGIICGYFILNLFEAIRAGFYDDEKAIKNMKENQADMHKDGLEVRPPNIDI